MAESKTDIRINSFQPQGTSIPQHGISMAQVETLLRKEMAADIPPNQDLGRFSTSHFPSEAWSLVPSSLWKNQACVEEYPSIARFKDHCISILANLWNAPSDRSYFGTATSGSSEAVQLGGLAMKRNWQLKHPDKSHSRMNVIMCQNSHICVRKFADYFDVEARVVPVNIQYTIDPKRLVGHLDDNTIGVFLTLGSTYTGHFDPIEHISHLLDRYQTETGNDIPIHVDAASGGFVAPFTPSNDSFVWDFRLPRVKSINTSGHKFGLTPLSVGWLIWREKSFIPNDLLLESSYLRGTQSAFTLSFSKSSTPVVVQYFQFCHLGLDGYRQIIHDSLATARLLSDLLEATGYFSCLSDMHRPISKCHGNLETCGPTARPGIPVVCFKLSDDFSLRNPGLCLSAFSDSMHDQKISIPNYTIPSGGSKGHDVEIMRIVVREDLTPELVEIVLSGLVHVAKTLDGRKDLD